MLDEDSQESHETDASSIKISGIYGGCERSETPVFDVLCRVCLQFGSIPIFDCDDENIAVDLAHFAGIEVSSDDCLPQHLCPQCQEFLESAIIFRHIAQKSDATLREQVECKSEPESLPDTKMKSDQSSQEDSDNGVYLELGSDNETIKSQDIVDYVDLFNKPDSNEDLKVMASIFKKAAGPRCEVCDLEFRTTELMDEHRKCHDTRDITICEVCQNIVGKNMYKSHLEVHKELFKQRTQRRYRKVMCTLCGKQVSKTYIKRHMVMHEQDKLQNTKYKKICNICDKSITLNNFQGHMKSKHSQKELTDTEVKKKQCQICSLMIKEESYKKHVESHASRLKKYVCEECGREFLYPSVFSTHLLTHKDQFKLKCQFCPYQAKHLGLLKIHVRTHTKDYSYKCNTCGRCFISKSNLSAHEKIHNDPQFSCSECGQKFKMERTMIRHHNTVHLGIKDFHCKYCKKAYGNRSGLLSHMRRVHNVKTEGRVGRTPSYLLVKDKDAQETVNVDE